MSTPSGGRTDSTKHASQGGVELEPPEQASTRLRQIVDLAERALGGPKVILAYGDGHEDWQWIGGEKLDPADTCRDRLLAAVMGNDVTANDVPEDFQADIIEDTLLIDADQPRLHWIAAHIPKCGALIACDSEPWEPDEQVRATVSGFGRLLSHEFSTLKRSPATRPTDPPEHFKNLIVESARDGILGIDERGNCRFANYTAAEMIGSDADRLLGTPVLDLFALDESSSVSDLHIALNGETVERSEATLSRTDGREVPVELEMLPSFDQDRQVSGAVLRFADLTDQKAAIQAARLSEARHQAFLAMTLDSIVTIDENGQILEFNLAAEETFQASSQEVIGKDMAEHLVPTPWRDWFRAAFHTFASTGGGPLNGRRVQMNAMRADGSSFPAEITITRLPDEQRWIFTLYIHDLTELKWNERRRSTRYGVTRALAETDSPSEALPQVLEEVCRGLDWDWAAYWRRDPGAWHLRLDRTWHRESVYTDPLEVASRGTAMEPGHNLLGEVWTKQQATWIQDLREPGPYLRADAALACGLHSVAAMPVVGRQEVIGVIEFLSQRIREPDAEMLRMMDSLGSQIGQYIERKNIEEERVQILAREQSARAEAEAAERRLAFLAEASAQLSASLDYETTLSNVARLAVPRLADYCAIQMLDDDDEVRTLEIADIDQEKERLDWQLHENRPVRLDSNHPVAQVVRSGRPLLYSEVDEDVLRLFAPGDEHYFEVLKEIGVDSAMYVPLVARGRTIGVISLVASESQQRFGPSDLALAQELTRRAALAIDNARLYREAQDAVRIREEFLSIASHELKTPLTTVKGYSQIFTRMLRRPHLDRERLSHLAGQLQDQLGRFETLIADLLDISRIQQGGLELRPEEADLIEIARTVVSRFDYASDTQRRHHFQILGPQSLRGVWDPDRLDQVLTNFLSNAVKYSPDGGEIKIDIASRDGDQVRLAVSDQGIGIPEEEQGQLFRPFARSETVQRAINGVGLGLYISQQIVDRHGGSVSLQSKPGQGSTFEVILPRVYPGTSLDGSAGEAIADDVSTE